MAIDTVNCSIDGGVATLALNRPEKLNALTAGMIGALREHLTRIASDPEIRCVVLRGEGRSFCAGHDLGSIIEADDDPAAAERFAAETIDALEQLPVPTIARIHGHCLTGGLELALACDLLIAARSASLGDTHGRWGLAPAWGMSVRLPERVGRSAAKELMFTSRRLSGDAAAATGLVDRAVPDDELDAAIDALVAEITANSAGTNRIYKALLADGHRMSRSEALTHERSMPYGIPEDATERLAGATTRQR